MFNQQHNGSTPLRHERSLVVKIDPVSGLPFLVREFESVLSLSPDDALHRVCLHYDRYVCGHDPRVEPGGSCNVCDGLVCRLCFRRCQGKCLKAICPRHSHVLDVGDPEPRLVCRDCFEGERRRRLVRDLRCAVIRQFVYWESAR